MSQPRGRTYNFVTYSTASAFVLIVFLAFMSERSKDVAGIAGSLILAYAGMVSSGNVALGARATMAEHKQNAASAGA